MILKLEKWGTRWGEGLPVGNGHTGAMVYGSPINEHIVLSENTFFSGEKSGNDNQEDAHLAFYKMRELLKKEKFKEAKEVGRGFIGRRNNYGTNLPVGTINIDYELEKEDIDKYQRLLALEEGLISSKCFIHGGEVRNEAFISHPDKVMIYHQQAAGRVINCKLKFACSNSYGNVTATDEGMPSLKFDCEARETLHSDGMTGVVLRGNISVITDGICSVENKDLTIKAASWFRLYIKMVTDYGEDDFYAACKQQEKELRHLLSEDYEAVKERHRKDFTAYMKRSRLELEGEEDISRIYQYGRYLLLSSSREDSKLPAHLQGAWNDNVACQIGWTCDMHLDINTQMNYWPAEVTNLAETTDPLVNWITDMLVPSGRVTARKSYGINGWAAEIVSNAWGFTAPYWALEISPMPTGGVWILTHMWEHYLFGRDKVFLREHFYPQLENAVEFFIDYLFWDENHEAYIGGPSMSPENSFVVGEEIYQVSNGCTFEMIMIRELFDIFLKCTQELHIENTLVDRVGEMIERLLPYQILEDGRIAEWMHSYPSSDSQHRHTSHLLGVYPFSQITPYKSKKLSNAVRKTMEDKLIREKGWEDTGWARALLILYSARLGDGEYAYQHVKAMMDRLREPNDMIIHPPTRGAMSFDNVYELDGNTGLTAAIAEMIIQSHDGVIRLLPALPAHWKKGKLLGVRIRGGALADIVWSDGALASITLYSEQDSRFVISYKEQVKEVLVESKKKTKLNGIVFGGEA